MRERDAFHEASADLTSAIPTSPEEHLAFRLAQLVLLLDVAKSLDMDITNVDRLGYYDFFSANPFAAIRGDEGRDDADRLSLRLAGFSEGQLSYASVGTRFASQRRRLQHDLSLLIAYGLVRISATGYILTSKGEALAANFTTVYADSYRGAAQIILRRLNRLTDRRLQLEARSWLGTDLLLLNVLDDVNETVPRSPLARPREDRKPDGRR